LIVVGALFMFAFGHIILASMLRYKTVKNEEVKLALYKRNMIFIQEFMKLQVGINKFFRILFEDDKSKLIEIMLVIRKISILVAVYFLACDLRYGPVYAYWLFLLSQTPQGQKIYEFAFPIFDKAITDLDRQLNKTIDQNINKISQYTTSPGKAITSSIHEIPKSSSPSVEEETKTFITYENMRWWVGAGFSHSTYPGERGGWSDYKGRVDAPRESFMLPSADWKWSEDWHVIKGLSTDEEGWEYSTDFAKAFHRSKGAMDFVRRRKWVRSCVKKGGPRLFK